MKPKTRSQRPPHHALARPGELYVSVLRRPNPDGTAELQIATSDLPVPDRKYTADAAGVIYDGTQAKLLFGQKKLGGDLRSLIIVSLSRDTVHRVLDTCQEFIPKNRDVMAKNDLAVIPLISPVDEPEQTVAMNANIITMARSGSETTMDFFFASPAAIHALRGSAGAGFLGIEAVVRVNLPLGALAPLLDELVSIASTIPRRTF